MDFVLASSSPRRLELLAQIGVAPCEIIPSDIDESARKGELPREYVERMALEKAVACQSDLPVLAADTIVTISRTIFGKAQSKDDARKILQKLSGRRHHVITTVALRDNARVVTKTVTSKLKMKRLSLTELDDYLSGEEWQGKAGAYAIQGEAAKFFPWISGSYSNIVGLPLYETSELLKRLK